MFGNATAGEFNATGRTAAAGEPASFYLPTVIAGVAASIGIIVGSSTPWLRVFVFDVDGLDVDGAGKATLALGVVSGIALIIQWALVKTASDLRFAVAVAWGVLVAGVACLAVAVITILRFTSTRAQFFDAIFGVQVAWGLWIVALCSPALSVAALITAVQVGKAASRAHKSSPESWSAAWGWAAVFASTVVVLCAVAYLWVKQNTGYDNAFWLHVFERLQH